VNKDLPVRPLFLPFPDTAFDVVVLASSAGGLKALICVLAGLPADFRAAIALVQHLAPQYPSLLAGILDRSTVLSVKQATSGDSLQPGMIFTAPPNEHLLINEDGTLMLSQSSQVNFVRPAADLLFKSAAAVCKARTIAVVLSGTGCDGATGVHAVKQAGGLVIAQDRATSEFFGMPDAAIHTGDVDFVLPLGEISKTLVALLAGELRNDDSRC
jgi:two-component system chemotaxis response regulator CheB